MRVPTCASKRGCGIGMNNTEVTPQLVAQCLTALMKNPAIHIWVHENAVSPGGGGIMERWNDLAYEYAHDIARRCRNP